MTAPPASVLSGVSRALAEAGTTDAEVVRVRPVGGGCINHASTVQVRAGGRWFLKWNASAPPDFFAAEAAGLRALRDASSLRVPEAVAVAPPGADPPWLLLELVSPGTGTPAWGVELGRGLAELHAPVEARCGWDEANYVGSLPQENPPSDDWPAFWRDARLSPLVRSGRDAGLLDSSDVGRAESLFERLPELLEPAADDGVALLHGDLWSGNVYADGAGRPVVVDPAVYRGHREVDLAMAELFGGFPRDFLPAYREARPLVPGYETVRRDAYQLYPLLVHVALFGRSYVAGFRQRVAALLKA